jgi:hypothetical protein
METITKYWWLLLAFGAVSALVVFRMRKRGGVESISRRVFYALFPYADPERSPQLQLSGPAAALIGGGVLLVSLLFLFLQSR